MSRQPLDFLGRGWAFPPSFGDGGTTTEMVEEYTDIEQSLRVLLSTRPGERLLDLDYGCDLSRFAFQSMNTTQQTDLADTVTTAILYHEPRIAVDEVTLDDGRLLEGVVLIEVRYQVRAANSRRTFVYPFYLRPDATRGTDEQA